MYPRSNNYSCINSNASTNGGRRSISIDNVQNSEDISENVNGGCVDIQNGLDNGEASNPEEEENDEDDSSSEEGASCLPFSVKSVEVAASSIAITNLKTEASEALARELSYKTKELLFVSKMIVEKSKSRVLKRSALNKALEMLGGSTLVGHIFSDDVGFTPVTQAGIFIDEEMEMDTVSSALSSPVYTKRAEPCIQGQWLLPDGYLEEASMSTDPNPYYTKISEAILNGKPSHFKMAIRDLQTNPKIGPFCPFFLNLVALTVKKVPRNIPLTNALIATLQAIAYNRYVELSPYLAVNRAANALLKIVIEVDAHKNFDDLSLRLRAGLLLAKVVETWNIGLGLQIDIIQYLLHHLLNSALPLQSHYGAIVTLAALGHRTLDFYVWRVMERYLSVVVTRKDSQGNLMVQYVIGAMMTALRITRKKASHLPNRLSRLAKVEEALYTCYGDSITPMRLAWADQDPVVSRAKVKREPLQHKLRIIQAPLIGRTKAGWKPSSYCVQRSIRFMKPIHSTSASGDIFLLM